MKAHLLQLLLLLLCLIPQAEAAPATHVQSVSYNSESITMRLTRQDLRGSNFELWAQNATGSYDVITPVAERSYLGTVDEYPDAVSFGIFQDDGKFRGGVIFDRGGCWWTLNTAVTKTRGLTQPSSFGFPTYTVEAGHGGSTTYGFDVGVDARYNYYQVRGGSNIAKTFEHIEFSLAATRASYMSNAMLRPYLARVIIRTDSTRDPYTGTTWSTYLTALKSEWDSNQTSANRDVVAGITTDSVGGGLAWVGAIASANAYSVNDSDSDGDFSIIWRHELGHNWGLSHFDGGAPEGKTFNSGNDYARMSGPELDKALDHRDIKLGALTSESTYTAVNLPPYAAVDGAKLIQVQQSSVSLNVLTNDHDANGHSVSLSSFDTTSSQGGSITQQGQNLVYTPPSGAYIGQDFFKYVIADSTGQTATGVVCVSVEPDHRLRLYLPMEEISGTILKDRSAFGKDADFVDNDLSTSTVTGKFGKGVDFDGSADYASVSGMSLSSNTVTLTAWIKPAAAQADYSGIIFDRSSDGVGLNIMSDRTLRYHWPASSYSYSWSSGLVVPADTWTFVALVVEPTKATIYMNSGSGFQSASRSATHQAGILNAVQIGRDPGSDSRFFDGSIDDVRIYDVSLSQTELLDIVAGGKAVSPRPVNGATGVTSRNLEWAPGAAATSNQVYFGTNQTSVTNATTSDPEYLGATTGSTYRPGISNNNTTYYWRVDTVTPSGTLKGDVWSFTTGILPPGDTILVNFRRDAGEAFAGGQLIGPTRDDSSSWNSVTGASGTSTALINNIGDATTAGISWSSSNLWNNGDSTSDDEGRLARGYLDDGGSGVSVTLSNIPYATYRVYGLIATDSGSAVVNASVNGIWALGGVSSTTAAAHPSISANFTAHGESWTRIQPGSVTGNYWSVVTSGATCTIAVRPRNGSSRGSLTGLIIEQIVPPGVPANLSATGSDSTISLSWTDNSNDETGFVVQRSTTSGSGFATIFTTSANATSYSNTGLGDGLTYYYRVMATNAAGNSTPSAEANATTYTAAEAWRFSHFGSTANSGVGADANDHDKDGTLNLFERAFGTDPADAASAHRPAVGATDVSGSNHLTITYRRLKNGSGTTGVNYSVDGLTYTVEYDADLAAPWSSGAVTQVGSAADNGDGTETVTVRLNAAMSAAARQFMQLKVTAAP